MGYLVVLIRLSPWVARGQAPTRGVLVSCGKGSQTGRQSCTSWARPACLPACLPAQPGGLPGTRAAVTMRSSVLRSSLAGWQCSALGPACVHEVNTEASCRRSWKHELYIC